jgi:hypothetical protein
MKPIAELCVETVLKEKQEGQNYVKLTFTSAFFIVFIM